MHTPSSSAVPVIRSAFASADEAEIVAFIGQVYAENSTRLTLVPHRARFSACSHDASGIGADRLRSTLDYRGSMDEGLNDFVAVLVHSGSVEVTSRDATAVATAVATAGGVISYPFGAPLDFTVTGLDTTVVRLPATTLQTCAAELVGPTGELLRFHALAPVSPALGR